MVMLKRISILLILLAGILKAQTPNNFYYDWKRGAVFSDTIAINKHIKFNNTSNLEMKQIKGGLHVLQDTALLPAYLRDSASVFQKKDNKLYRWTGTKFSQILAEKQDLQSVMDKGAGAFIADDVVISSNSSFQLEGSEFEIASDGSITIGTVGTPPNNQINFKGNFAYNAGGAGYTPLTNGQTLISDGSKMVGEDVETYVRDSVVDFIKVTTASESPGTAVPSGGDIKLTYTVTGVSNGDAIQVTPTEAYGSSSVFLPYVAYYSAPNTVTVRIYNPFSTAVTPADIQFYILVTKAK